MSDIEKVRLKIGALISATLFRWLRFFRPIKEKCKVSDKMIVVLQSRGKKTWKK